MAACTLAACILAAAFQDRPVVAAGLQTAACQAIITGASLLDRNA